MFVEQLLQQGTSRACNEYEVEGPARYLIILTTRLPRLLAELHTTPYPEHGEVLKRYQLEVVR